MKRSFWIVLLALVVLIGGAWALYSRLGAQMNMPQLNAQPAKEAEVVEEAAEIEPAEEAEEPKEPDESEEEAPQEPQPAPEFTIYDQNGDPVTLADFRGKPVVLNFWASWCGPCKSEMADFDAAYAEYGDEIHFVMINRTDGARETKETAMSYVESEGFSFPVYFDSDNIAAAAYGVYGIPTTFFIDAEGNGVVYGSGAMDLETLKLGLSYIYDGIE